MKVISIFVEESSLLYTVQYDNDKRDSLTIAYDELTDTEWLRIFFKQFKSDFEAYYGTLNINEVIGKTIGDADRLFNELLQFSENGDLKNLSELFKPLDNNEENDPPYNLQQLKTYGNSAPWIRIYVVRYRDVFVFTGGTIKLTKYMNQRQHTKNELFKLNLVRGFLKEKGEDGESGYIELKQDD